MRLSFLWFEEMLPGTSELLILFLEEELDGIFVSKIQGLYRSRQKRMPEEDLSFITCTAVRDVD